MRVARLDENLEVGIAEMDVPAVGPGEILVRTRACGICTGDIMGWYMRRKAPLVFGHEPAGEVAAVGAGVQRAASRAIVCSSITMRRAWNARSARAASSCSARRGARASSCRAAWRSISRCPRGKCAATRCGCPTTVSFADAALIEPLACTVKSMRRAGLRGGERVVVIGLGIMGQLHVVLARHAGA